MGCASSIQSSSLNVSSPVNQNSDSFTGSFHVVCKSRVTLNRDIRATLKLRATLVTLTGAKDEFTNEPEKREKAFIMWDVGGVIHKRRIALEPGENSLDFDFPLEGKLEEVRVDKYIQPEDLVKKFGSCTYIKYDYILRAGSLEVQEFVHYLNLFPPGENGIRVIGKEGISVQEVMSLVSLGAFAASIAFG